MRSYLQIALIALAGESIFLLPFVLQRIFRPTFLKALDISNTELGICFSIYGITALVSYFLGGPIADRFSPRKLMAFSLLLTAGGGIVLGTFPEVSTLYFLYGYWGVTTILLFWAAMIKITRISGENKQGSAFGFLDGGRGLLASIIGTIGIILFASSLKAVSMKDIREAFQQVIWFASGFVGFVAIIVWIFLKDIRSTSTDRLKWKQVKKLLQNPTMYAIMLIVLCGYVGYKMTDFMPQYASEILGFNEVQSAQLGTALLYGRPLVAVFIGILADRISSSKLISYAFMLSAITGTSFATGILTDSRFVLFLFSTAIVAISVYAIRAVYFALISEVNISIQTTGTAVGLISVVGFTPDIFVGPTSGYLLDSYTGIIGYRYLFTLLIVFAIIGLIAAWFVSRLKNKTPL